MKLKIFKETDYINKGIRADGNFTSGNIEESFNDFFKDKKIKTIKSELVSSLDTSNSIQHKRIKELTVIYQEG